MADGGGEGHGPTASVLTTVARAIRGALGIVRSSRAATAGGVLLGLYGSLGVFGPTLAPYPYAEFHIESALQPPSRKFLAGTDQFGRDQLSRVVWGTRGTLGLAVVSTVVGVGLGVVVGMVGGFYRGVLDEVLMRMMDVLMAVPSLLLAMLILATLGTGSLYVIIGIATVFMPRASRVIRGVALSLASAEFVDAARVRGESGGYIIFREMLPNAWTPIIVEVTIRFSYAILLSTSLGFLGVGASPPAPDWGLMINEGLPFLQQAPWLVTLPAIAISTAVIGANLLGDGVQEALAARQRR